MLTYVFLYGSNIFNNLFVFKFSKVELINELIDCFPFYHLFIKSIFSRINLLN
jgi:hypothetical protein